MSQNIPLVLRYIILKREQRGFILPLTLITLLIIMVVSLWAYKGVILDLYSTLSQKNTIQEFYAAESAIYKTIYEKIVPSSLDTSEKNYNYTIYSGNRDITVNVTLKPLDISRNCTGSACCQRFEVKACVNNCGIIVKVITDKALYKDYCSNLY